MKRKSNINDHAAEAKGIGKNKTRVYVATFHYVQYSTATQEIAAKSLPEALRIADETDVGDIKEFDPQNGELSVDAVELLKKGAQSHE